MHRAAYAVIALLGCGRIGFDATGTDAGDGGPQGPRISTQLPDGGEIIFLTEAPDGAWYAATPAGASFRSDDHTSWVRCGARYTRGIAVDAAGTVWAGGPDIARSTDRCATWQNTGSPRYANGVSFAASGTLYGLLDDRIVRWSGSTWIDVPTPLGATTYWSMASAGNVILAGSYDGIARTTDGMTWTGTTAGIPSGEKRVAIGTTRAYVITNGGAPGIGCSVDAGQTWTQCDNTGGFSLLVDPGNEQRVLAAVYDDLILTTNGFGATTRQLRDDVGLDNALVLALMPASDGSIVLASERGIYVSPSSGTIAFEPRMTDLQAWDIDEMLRIGDDIYLSTNAGVLHAAIDQPFTVSTTGINWNTRIGGVAPLPDGRIIAVGRNIIVSSDRGTTWTELKPFGVEDGYFANTVEIAGSRAYVGTYTEILVGDPPYTSWAPVLVGGQTREVTALRVLDGTVYAGTLDGLYIAPDATTFAQQSPAPVRAITALADGGLAIATANGVIMTDPSRATFAAPTLTGRNVTRVLEVDTTLVATSDTGASYSRDRGATWQPLPGAMTTQADDVLYDGELVLGTTSGLVRVPMP